MASLGRASAIIGAGTLVSRMTGLVRSILLVAVIGSYESRPADAFAIASALPTNVYELLAAGVITVRGGLAVAVVRLLEDDLLAGLGEERLLAARDEGVAGGCGVRGAARHAGHATACRASVPVRTSPASHVSSMW